MCLLMFVTPSKHDLYSGLLGNLINERSVGIFTLITFHFVDWSEMELTLTLEGPLEREAALSLQLGLSEDEPVTDVESFLAKHSGVDFHLLNTAIATGMARLTPVALVAVLFHSLRNP